MNKDWSFKHLTRKQTTHGTHGYHSYPAKFIPQLAERLILENSKKGDKVLDPFCGSGTTIVEAVYHERKATGIDISPFACLLSRVKTTHNNSLELENALETLEHIMTSSVCVPIRNRQMLIPDSPMAIQTIHKWFPAEAVDELGMIFGQINLLAAPNVRAFFQVCFSQCLKGCSLWSSKSIKPYKKLDKKTKDPWKHFLTICKRNIKANSEFCMHINATLAGKDNYHKPAIINDSAKFLPTWPKGMFNLVVTSPPYATAYEYSDLHQLSNAWLCPDLKQAYIGSMKQRLDTKYPVFKSDIALEIIKQLPKARGLAAYFADMCKCFEGMYYVLKKGSKACIVIGDTRRELQVIPTTRIFIQQLKSCGFHNIITIEREITSKNLPCIRDKVTGKFVKATKENAVIAYPTENIIIAER